ncbi:S41 family peptidase [Shewanella sp. SNU WT4]|uniref:S41 family peptidase n=1 Tax=Shewanella sp. SNU WT4 TaxID=2590015 RepID=UPI001129AEEB|nr:S41 family peptidase [Shewanella sp. SNU WT4]QDF65577.1 S41 family peptidase [Shewanella sp. SNU WT4]
MAIVKAIILLICGAVLGVLSTLWHQGDAAPPVPATNTISEVINLVQTHYVDSLSEQQLIDAALQGIVSQLDPYSSYLSQPDLLLLEQSNKGEYFGFGFEVAADNKTDEIRILTPFYSSPAAHAGIEPGDIITHLFAEPVNAAKLNDFLAAIRRYSHQRQNIELSLNRQGTVVNVELAPNEIHIESVSVDMLKNNIGYVKITHFQEDTASKLEGFLQQWQLQTLTGVILDLRDNPGGLLDQAVQVADLLLDDGKIVSVQGRYFAANTAYFADEASIINGIPIVVLINHGSASAAEIVAAALQENRRALLMGETSFGKGTVQTVLPMASQLSAMKLTIANYLTPAGNKVHQQGIEPDIKINVNDILTAKNVDIIGNSSNNKEKQSDEILATAIHWFSASP